MIDHTMGYPYRRIKWSSADSRVKWAIQTRKDHRHLVLPAQENEVKNI